MTHNVVTFLWRTLFQQSVQKNLRYVVLEFLYVMMVGFLLKMQVFESLPRPLSENSVDVDVKKALVPPLPSVVVFGPNSTYSRLLVDTMITLLVNAAHPRQVTAARKGTADKHGGYLSFPRRNEQSGDSDGDQSSEGGDKHETVPDAADLKYVEVESRDAVAGACAKLYDLKMFPNENSTAILRAPLCLALSEPESAASASLEYTVYVPTEDVGKMEKMLPLGGAFAPNDNLTLAIGYQFMIEATHIALQAKSAVRARQTVPNMEDFNVRERLICAAAMTSPLNRTCANCLRNRARNCVH